jgi:hypothetical protein
MLEKTSNPAMDTTRKSKTNGHFFIISNGFSIKQHGSTNPTIKNIAYRPNIFAEAPLNTFTKARIHPAKNIDTNSLNFIVPRPYG